MPVDPLAAGFALGGLILMMVEAEPSWRGVIVGLLAVLAFGVTGLLSRGHNRKARPMTRGRAPSLSPRQIPAEGLPEGWRADKVHPALLAAAPAVDAPKAAKPASAPPSWSRRRSRRAAA